MRRQDETDSLEFRSPDMLKRFASFVGFDDAHACSRLTG
jgi:hypothetical protein